MNDSQKITPPKWPLRILRFFLKKEYLEEVEGDMEEEFHEYLEFNTPKKASKMYALEVFKLMRLNLIKNSTLFSHSNELDMFKNHLKTSVRSLKRNALFSTINVVGLAISMSVGILMIVLLSEFYSFDNFHTRKDNIYRVTSTHFNGTETNNYASSSIYIGRQIKEQVPGVDKVLIMRRNMRADIIADKGAIAINGFYASNSFFDVFSFELIKGNPKTALADPYGIVLTESTALKLFGEENPIGKSVAVDRNWYFKNGTITGVVKDPPMNSHIQFEALVSMKTLDKHVQGMEKHFMNNWEDIWSSYVYLILNENSLKGRVQTTMDKIMNANNKIINDGEPIMHTLQPLQDIVPSDDYYNELGPTYLKSRVFMMISLALIVLLSACFNYTNLSLARALRRSKEVGIRKITGASRLQIFMQFTIEAIMLAAGALFLGVALFYVVRPEFMSLPNDTANGYQMYLLNLKAIHILYLIIFALLVGVLAGIIPALSLSKLKAKVVLKDASKLKLFSGMNLRKVLIMLQFAMSISLIMYAVMVHKQYKFALNYDLGYDTNNIMNIRIKGTYLDQLENEYATMPDVLATSRSATILGVGSSWVNSAISDDRGDTVSFTLNYIDHKYLDMHQFELVAGEGFVSLLKQDEPPKYIVVNEKFLKDMELGSPQEAIGKSIWHNRDMENNPLKLKIIGVVKNFVDASLWKTPRPFGFMQTNSRHQYQILGVKVRGNDILSILADLEEKYEKLDPVHPFEATFYDDRIAQTYQQQQSTYKIISFLAMLAVSISTLGLLGITVFTTESRMKEVSIRKVLGAGIGNIMLLLSKGFLAMVLIAGIITIPITFYLVEDMVLSDFAYRTKIGIVEIISGFAIVMLIGIVTVGWQIRQVAVQNPADLLRDE